MNQMFVEYVCLQFIIHNVSAHVASLMPIYLLSPNFWLIVYTYNLQLIKHNYFKN